MFGDVEIVRSTGNLEKVGIGEQLPDFPNFLIRGPVSVGLVPSDKKNWSLEAASIQRGKPSEIGIVDDCLVGSINAVDEVSPGY